MRCALTRNYFVLFNCCLLNLIITSSYLFYYHLSSSAEYFVSVHRCPLASTADASVDRPRSPSSTAIAQCLRSPWPIPEAGVCPLCPSQLPLHFFLCPRIGDVEATIASSPIVSSSSLLPCPAPHLLLPSFVGMAAIVAVAPSSMADCCAFFITCTPSSLSFTLYHAIAGS